jgi:deoxyribodipyrimidine photo-lyase
MTHSVVTLSLDVPASRVAAANTAPVLDDRPCVLYWMIAARRGTWNFGLQRAVEWASRLGKPLVVLEALRAGYPWASDRFHAFVLQGMADNRRHFSGSGARYYAYVEPAPGAGRGLLEALACEAAVIVTDDFPAFFLRRMVAAAAARSPVRLETVDSNGLVPMRASPGPFPTAYAFRRFLQKTLPAHLQAFPKPDPLQGLALPRPPRLPDRIASRWPEAGDALLAASGDALAILPIDHSVGIVATRGGTEAASAALDRFLADRLSRYLDDRAHPDRDASSGLSPYLHFGHVSAHQVFSALMTRERWTTRALSTSASGRREGWWGASPAAESFLDELITWRELGYAACHHQAEHDRYESLPGWARDTLAARAADRRAHVYSLDEFERARTHDRVWNAAQTQLVREGRLHNYLRMLWGKKILEWTATPQDALAVMVELNNKYALDGRDPNSYSGIFWVLGRYDRPWAPQRPIFGSIRYMSSENTLRKLRMKEYLRRYAPEAPGLIT